MTPTQLLGRRLGPYRIEAILGHGSMAVVYRARREEDDEPVALKVLLPGPNTDETVRRRFEREARTAARLRHPAIVRVLDAGRVEQFSYMAMQQVKGQTLAERLAQIETLAEGAAAQIGEQVAEGLHYAHSQGVVHRDVKPANILLTPDDRAMLFDFGVAQIFDEPTLIQAKEAIGTPIYMAPEQASGADSIDGRADLYALGVVLFRAMTGRPPFQGSSSQVMQAHLHHSPPEPSTLASVSPPMEAIIMRALAKEPADRFQTGQEMAQALAKVSQEANLAGSSSSFPTEPHAASPWLWVIPLVLFILWLIWQFTGAGGLEPIMPPPAP